jgi:cytochrome c biogenesis protein CcdA
MSIIGILIVLVVVGLCLYLVQTYVPMAQPIKTVIGVVVVLVLCLWLLQAFGIIDGNVFNSRHPLR